MTIGERIKARRLELGLSIEDLGKILGKNRTTVYRYETGYIENLPIEIIKPIAEALRTTPQYLMGWEKVQKNNDAIVDIIQRLRTDEDFLSLVKKLSDMDAEKLKSLSAFLK